jgi:hypothetical protein
MGEKWKMVVYISDDEGCAPGGWTEISFHQSHSFYFENASSVSLQPLAHIAPAFDLAKARECQVADHSVQEEMRAGLPLLYDFNYIFWRILHLTW